MDLGAADLIKIGKKIYKFFELSGKLQFNKKIG
jgi:hypothetical protein